MIKNYLFDLDGTLLPLDEKQFLDLYIGLIGQKFHELGYDSKVMVKRLWDGTGAMVKNDGQKANEDVFWDVFYPEKTNQEAFKKALVKFYQNEFQQVKASTNPDPYAKKIIKALKDHHANIYLLTNPIFPMVATKQRIEWAGLEVDDFNHITTYENSIYAKPNLKYYQDVLEKFNLNPDETMMVGNDVDEDMIAEKLGLKTYLVTTCIKNTNDRDISRFNHGSLKDFYQLVAQSH